MTLAAPSTRTSWLTTPTWPTSRRASRQGSGAVAGRPKSRCRSRRGSAIASSAAGSTRSSPTIAAGGFDVVDWKTGRPPRPGREERAVAVQLAAYRLAWAALAGVPVAEVRAAFYYVRENLTVRPADLLDADGLAALIENVPADAQAVR